MTRPVQRFDMEPEDITRLMSDFYTRIRADAELGPIFARAIGTGDAEWRAHEAKIAAFWRNAIGMDRAYQGNPMRAHTENGEVRAEHFVQWLNLFRTSARAVLAPRKAAAIIALAERIGQGLSHGIAMAQTPPGAPPKLGL